MVVTRDDPARPGSCEWEWWRVHLDRREWQSQGLPDKEVQTWWLVSRQSSQQTQDVSPMLGQRRRRWPNINPTLSERLVFAVLCHEAVLQGIADGKSIDPPSHFSCPIHRNELLVYGKLFGFHWRYLRSCDHSGFWKHTPWIPIRHEFIFTSILLREGKRQLLLPLN